MDSIYTESMTVGLLKRFLQDLPDSLPVLVSGYERGWTKDIYICTAMVVRNEDHEDYEGEFLEWNKYCQVAEYENALLINRR